MQCMNFKKERRCIFNNAGSSFKVVGQLHSCPSRWRKELSRHAQYLITLALPTGVCLNVCTGKALKSRRGIPMHEREYMYLSVGVPTAHLRPRGRWRCRYPWKERHSYLDFGGEERHEEVLCLSGRECPCSMPPTFYTPKACVWWTGGATPQHAFTPGERENSDI